MSQLTMAKRWKWSRGKVRRFLNDLETEQMIVQQTGQHTTLVSICNYDKYQGGGTTGGTTESTANGTVDGQQTGHIQESKEYNIGGFAKPSLSELVSQLTQKKYPLDQANRIATEFLNYYESVNWKIGKAKKPMASWPHALANWVKDKPPQQGTKTVAQLRAEGAL